MRATVDWQDIETVPDGQRVLLWLEHGEKGNGEIAVGMVVRLGPDVVDSYWTWGGPNSGSDIDERPTKWALLPFAPGGKIHE